MRLILVHGINNQNNTSESIKSEWMGAINSVIGDDNAIDGVEIIAPFYGDKLAEFTNASESTVADVIAQGVETIPQQNTKFATDMLLEMAPMLGIQQSEIDALPGPDVVEQGFILDRILHPLLSLVEDKFPGVGDFALQFIQQANAYFNHPGAKRIIDDMVKPALITGEPQIVVGHSLGTVVTYSILRELTPATTLYVTLGSPLALKTFRRKLGPPRLIPDGVSRWLNGIDPSDPAALGQALTADNFADGIDNVDDINNGFGLKAHSVLGYLSDPRIARPIAEAIR